MSQSITRCLLCLFIFCFYVPFLTAQVGINTDNGDPDASAMLDIKSTDKGVLIPRLTTAQRMAIPLPAKGLMVYDSTAHAFWYYNGTNWSDLSAVNDADADVTNEIQDLELIGNNLKITKNGTATTIDLSTYLDNTDTQLTESQVDGFVANNGFITNPNDADADATNEIQDLELIGNNLKITKNGTATTIDLSTYLDNTDTQLTESQVDGFVANNGFITNPNDADADATNEIQDLELIGNNLKITKNGTATTIDLSTYLDNTDTQLTETQVDGFVANNGYITNANDADADVTNEIQDLELVDNNLKITNNGSATTVDLSTYLDNTDTQLTESQVDGFVANNGYLTSGDDFGNHTAITNITLGTNYLSNDGTDGGIYLDGSNNVGINTATPSAKFHVNGTIVAGANATVSSPSLNGGEGILIPGGTSDYIISAQDGNGRVQHKWNASHGINETFLVGGEDAAFLDINGVAADDNAAWIEFKHADGASVTAGDPISWNTQLIINQGGEVGINETSPDDKLHLTDGGNGTRVRVENSSNGWAGMVAKNTQREIFIGVQGAFDANPGELHIFDNTAGARRLVIDAAGEVGIGKDNPSVKLDVNGAVNCTGGTCSSDVRWKKNILPLENVLSNIQQLRGVSYDWKKLDFPEKDFGKEKQIGLIAQEVEAIYPELIRTDEEGYKSMDYMSFTAVLLEATKALTTENEDASKKIEALEKENKELLILIAKINTDLSLIKTQLNLTADK